MIQDDGKMFQGVYAVLYALFNADETIDHGAMAAQIEYCIAEGCHGITVLGLATEVLKLTPEERIALVETAGKTIASRVPFSVTLAGNSVAAQIALGKAALAAHADWLILQPPMTGNYDADVYMDFFGRVAGGLDCPIAIQNAPQYLGRALSSQDIAQLRNHASNIVAVKSEDTAEENAKIIKSVAGDMHVLGGRGGEEMMESLRHGCKGFILAPDIAPVAARIYDLWRGGDTAAAAKLHGDAAPAIAFCMQSIEHLITYGKRIMGDNAGLAIHDRAPCLAPTPESLKESSHWAKHLQRIKHRAM